MAGCGIGPALAYPFRGGCVTPPDGVGNNQAESGIFESLHTVLERRGANGILCDLRLAADGRAERASAQTAAQPDRLGDREPRPGHSD